MQQGDLVAEALQRARPMMRGATGFEQDLGRGAVRDIRWRSSTVPGALDTTTSKTDFARSTPICVLVIGLLHRVFVAFGAGCDPGIVVPFGGGVHSITCCWRSAAAG